MSMNMTTSLYQEPNYVMYPDLNNMDIKITVANYELININGKWSFRRWKKFLDKFGLQSYFIGDWDNIQDTGVKVDMKAYRKYIEGLPKTRRYPTMIQMIQAHNPEKWQEIIAFIDELYNENIYLLKQG